MDNDPELPRFVYWGGLSGLILLAISIIVFIVFIVLYNEANDSNVSLNSKNMDTIESSLYITYLSTGGLGFLLALLIPFGHYIKSYNDPSMVHGRNLLHFETTDVKNDKILATPLKETSSYKLAGSLGSDLLPERESRFKEDINVPKDRFSFA